MRRLLVLALIWGWSFLFIKVAVRGFPPLAVAFGRCAVGATLLVALARSRGHVLPSDRRVVGHLLVVALAGSAVPFTLLAWGEERITSALTAVLNASTPLFTALFAIPVLGERVTRRQVAGLLLGLVGVGVAAGVGVDDLSGSSVAGAAAAVGAGLCYGFSFAWSKRHLMAIPPMVAAAGQIGLAALVLLPAAVLASVGKVEATPGRVAAIVVLGLGATGIAYILNFGVIADLGPTRAALSTYLVPVVAVAVGVTVLDEPLRLGFVVGGAITVAGIVLVHRGHRGHRPSPVPLNAD